MPDTGAAQACPCCDEAVTRGASSAFDVFVVGGVGIDTVVRVPSLPPEDRDSFLVPPVESYVAHTGHGVVMGCHALGLRTALADVIGDDEEGRRIVAEYGVAGVDLRYVTHAERHPPRREPGGAGRAADVVLRPAASGRDAAGRQAVGQGDPPAHGTCTSRSWDGPGTRWPTPSTWA